MFDPEALKNAEFINAELVPALYAPWVDTVIDVAQLEPGHKVLDAGCGTGALCRAALPLVTPDGSVTGLDPIAETLAVAARHSPGAEWRHARSPEFPFGAGIFDVVLSLFGLTRFEDPRSFVREMVRVLHRGGRLAMAVRGDLQDAPALAGFVSLTAERLGEAAANALRQPFSRSDRDRLRGLLDVAGMPSAQIRTHTGEATFKSTRAWAETLVYGWVLPSVDIADDDIGAFLDLAENALEVFADASGQVTVSLSAHVVSAIRP